MRVTSCIYRRGFAIIPIGNAHYTTGKEDADYGVLYGHMTVYNPNYEYTGDASVTMKGNNGEDIVIGDEEAEVFPSRLIK